MSAELRIRRILVALDASPQSLAALEAAVEMASGLDAELLGIFVEDINLVRLAAMPGVREVGRSSAAARPLEAARMQRQLRARAERVRKAMAQAADAARVRWTLQIARGAIEAELLRAAVQADLVILGRAGWSGVGRLGSTARALLAQAPGSALVLEAGERLRPALIAVYDGSDTAQRALETAAAMAIQRSGQLVVGIPAEEDEQAAELEQAVAAWLKQHRIEGSLQRLRRPYRLQLARMIEARRDCMLVLPGESEWLRERPLAEALSAFKCPVLVVR